MDGGRGNGAEVDNSGGGICAVDSELAAGPAKAAAIDGTGS